METAIVRTPPLSRRATDPTLGFGAGLERRSTTPLVSQSFGGVLGADAFSLAGGDVLVRLAGRDIMDRLLGWWTLDELKLDIGALAPATAERKPTSALDAAHLLMELFDISMESLATATGVGRTTILHWQREGSSPRPSTVTGLWRLYGLGMALRSVLGVAGARSWLRSGATPPMDALSAGDIAAFEQLVTRVAFDSHTAREFEVGIGAGPVLELRPVEGLTPARGTRHRRRRLRA